MAAPETAKRKFLRKTLLRNIFLRRFIIRGLSPQRKARKEIVEEEYTTHSTFNVRGTGFFDKCLSDFPLLGFGRRALGCRETEPPEQLRHTSA